jgi:tetratricopeptide (TPR) repeat protein
MSIENVDFPKIIKKIDLLISNNEDDKAIKFCKELYMKGVYNLDLVIRLSGLLIHKNKLLDAEQIINEFTSRGEASIEILLNTATIFIRTHRSKEAINLLNFALDYYVNNVDIYYNLTHAYSLSGSLDNAFHTALKAIELNPLSPIGHSNLSSVLKQMGKFEDAIYSCETALKIDPNHLESILNYVSLTIHDANIDKISILNNAKLLALKNSKEKIDNINYLLSFCYLLNGDLSNAWNLHDFGLSERVPVENGGRGPKRQFKVPMYNGQKTNQPVLLWKEAGLGDELMYLSCLNDFLNIHNNIILECDHRLVQILSRSFPNIRVRPESYFSPPSLLPHYDDYSYHLPIGSLMRFVRNDFDSFKNSKPYLKSSNSSMNKIKSRLDKYNGFLKIGLSWRSGLRSPERNFNYHDIVDWENLFKLKNTIFINLQYSNISDEIKEVFDKFGVEIIYWDDINYKDDLDDLISISLQCDYVITTATAIQHIASSAGSKVLLISDYGTWAHFGKNYDPWFKNMIPFKSPNNEVINDIIDYINDDRGIIT